MAKGRKAVDVEMLDYHVEYRDNADVYEDGAVYSNSRLFKFKCPMCGYAKHKGYKFKTLLQRSRTHFTECDKCKTTYRVDLPDKPFEVVEAVQKEMFKG